VAARTSSARDKQSCAIFEFGCISAWRCQALLYLEQVHQRGTGGTGRTIPPAIPWPRGSLCPLMFASSTSARVVVSTLDASRLRTEAGRRQAGLQLSSLIDFVRCSPALIAFGHADWRTAQRTAVPPASQRWPQFAAPRRALLVHMFLMSKLRKGSTRILSIARPHCAVPRGRCSIGTNYILCGCPDREKGESFDQEELCVLTF
jgi:hypothetical protein